MFIKLLGCLYDHIIGLLFNGTYTFLRALFYTFIGKVVFICFFVLFRLFLCLFDFVLNGFICFMNGCGV